MPVNCRHPFWSGISTGPNHLGLHPWEGEQFRNREGRIERVSEPDLPRGADVHQQALKLNGFPKSVPSLSLLFLIPFGSSQALRVRRAEEVIRTAQVRAQAGSTASQNCWLPLNSWMRRSGT